MIATILLKYLRLSEKLKNFELIQKIEFAEKPYKSQQESKFDNSLVLLV